MAAIAELQQQNFGATMVSNAAPIATGFSIFNRFILLITPVQFPHFPNPAS